MITGPIASMLLLAASVPTSVKESTPMDTHTPAQSADAKAAEAVVAQYMRALRSADAATIVDLYADDAVFLPAGAPTIEGKAAIAAAYTANFKMMNVRSGESAVEEAAIHGDIALVRLATRSTVVILTNNQETQVNARELFILKKVDGQWKISRYMFNNS